MKLGEAARVVREGRAGRCERKPTTAAGEVAIRMPELKGMRLATAVIGHCRRREASVEEAMTEMHPAGVSIGRIEDASETLRGSSASAAAASDLNGRALAPVEERRGRPLGRARPYVRVDGIRLKRSWGGSCANAAAMAAIGVNDSGFREAVGAPVGAPPAAQVEGGGARMSTGDEAADMAGSIAEVLPEAACRRRAVRFHRSVSSMAPRSKRPGAAAMPKAIHAMEPREASEAKALAAADGLDPMKPREAAEIVRGGLSETPAPHAREQRRRAPEPGGPQAHPRGRDPP